MPPAPAQMVDEVHVDGQVVDLEDFTFEELDLWRDLVRESAGDPEISPALAAPMDRWPAMITVFKRRTDPDYTIEDAKKLKPSEIVREVPVKRPQKATRAKKA